TGRAVGSVIEDALRDYLERARVAQATDVGPLPSIKSGGVRPGVDLNDMSAVIDIMDEGIGPDALR
ncbi:MAG: CopG family transcriptional regulator, partial [Actinomycetota bacterium]